MIIIATLAIGPDFRKGLKKALDSKRAYANKHGYVYLEGDEAVWDRTRPIAWSKVGFLLSILKRVPDGTMVWLSDADVLITNPDRRLEEHVFPLLPAGKNMLLFNDACGHLNSGNILMRNCAWLRDFWERVDACSEFTYHIWWENAAIIHLLESKEIDRGHVVISDDHRRLNAYLQGLPDQPLWRPGDFLVHFAGVYNISRMEGLIDAIGAGKIPRISMTDPEKIEFINI